MGRVWVAPDRWALVAVLLLGAAPFSFFAIHSYKGTALTAFLGIGLAFLIGGLVSFVVALWQSRNDPRLPVLLWSALFLSMALTSLAFADRNGFLGASTGIFGGVVVAFAAEYGLFRSKPRAEGPTLDAPPRAQPLDSPSKVRGALDGMFRGTRTARLWLWWIAASVTTLVSIVLFVFVLWKLWTERSAEWAQAAAEASIALAALFYLGNPVSQRLTRAVEETVSRKRERATNRKRPS